MHQNSAVLVLHKEPSDLAEALHHMEIHVKNYETVFGAPPRKTVRSVSFEELADREYTV